MRRIQAIAPVFNGKAPAQALLFFLLKGLKNKEMRTAKSVVSGALIIGVFGLLAGCNTTSSQVKADYISPFKYDAKSCSELKKELTKVEQKATRVASNVDSIKETQDAKLAIGWLFWPSYLIIDDNKAEAKELSKIRGEFDALKSAINSKKCDAEKSVEES